MTSNMYIRHCSIFNQGGEYIFEPCNHFIESNTPYCYRTKCFRHPLHSKREQDRYLFPCDWKETVFQTIKSPSLYHDLSLLQIY